MKEIIKNMIDFDEITRVRSSVGSIFHMPKKNSLVSLIPLEHYKNSVKVLINGKLFLAQIDEGIPLNEEIIALVIEDKPFTLSLNLAHYFHKNQSFLLDQIIAKLNIKNNTTTRTALTDIINNELPVIKSKCLQLEELTKVIKVKDLELSLLINLVWHYKEEEFISLKDLFENLFVNPFSDVVDNIFRTLKEILFAEEDNYLQSQLNSKLIFNENSDYSHAIGKQTEIIYGLIKYLNETKVKNNSIRYDFIKYSTIYILQKSVFKDFDFFPDFLVIRRNNSLSLIKYSFKRMYLSKDKPSYKLEFENKDLPIKLKGFLRNNFLMGAMENEVVENISLINELDRFKNRLSNSWQINSDITINSIEEHFAKSKLHKQGFNKLVS